MLAHYAGWIFDLDGTLTVHQHDFEAIRVELGIPAGRYILEHIEALAPEAARHLRVRLEAIESELTAQAVVASGADALLAALATRGVRLGILTRNSRANALATLESIGLAAYFPPAAVLGRDEAAPKPAPQGIERLLQRWCLPPHRCLMVGDFHLDLAAGRNAGVTTVHVHADSAREWPELTDHRVASLADLLAMVGA